MLWGQLIAHIDKRNGSLCLFNDKTIWTRLKTICIINCTTFRKNHRKISLWPQGREGPLKQDTNTYHKEKNNTPDYVKCKTFVLKNHTINKDNGQPKTGRNYL